MVRPSFLRNNQSNRNTIISLAKQYSDYSNVNAVVQWKDFAKALRKKVKTKIPNQHRSSQERWKYCIIHFEKFYLTLSTYYSRKDFSETFNSCYGFGLPSSKTVLKLIERLTNWIWIWDLCIVYKCDVSDSPSLENKGETKLMFLITIFFKYH